MYRHEHSANIRLTGVGAGLAFACPVLQETLRRDPAVLQSGAWWRLLSPLLVRTDTWFVLAIMLVGTLAAGYVVERGAGRWQWMALYLGAGLVGQAFGYAWDPHGAGSSVAILGLFAWIWYQAWRRRIDKHAQFIGVAGLAALAAIAGANIVADSPIVSAVLAVGVGAVGVNVVQRVPASAAGLMSGGLALLLGIGLTLVADNHGPAVLAGLLIAGVMDLRV